MKHIRLWLLCMVACWTVYAALGGRYELAVELLISVALLVGSEIEHP